VIYFAQYAVLSVDKDAKTEVVKRLEVDLKTKHEDLDKQAHEKIETIKNDAEKKIADVRKNLKSKEQQEIQVKEVQFKQKQEIAQIRETVAREKDTAAEVYKTISSLYRLSYYFMVTNSL